MKSEDLNNLTERHPECLLAAFADIGSGVTLLTGGSSSPPREALDEMCAEAAMTLGSADSPAFGADPCPMAIKSADGLLFVYLRSPEEPNDALICMCNSSISLEGLMEDARACFEGSG